MLRLRRPPVSPDQSEAVNRDTATGGSVRKDQNVNQDSPVLAVSISDTSSKRKLDFFACSNCGKQFSDPSQLFAHKRDMHALQKVTLPLEAVKRYFDYPNRRLCPICKKGIRSRGFRSIFLKHILTHTTGVKYKCAVCKQEFTRMDHMKMHEKRHIFPVQKAHGIWDQVNCSVMKLELPANK